MDKIAIFFGPEDGAVDRVAQKVKNAIGEEKVVMIPVKGATVADLEKYDKIIFGISTVGKETWHTTYNNVDWANFLPEIAKTRYEGKTVAVFGLGDHVTYGATFVDHIGLLGRELMKNGATLVGQVPTDGYEFDDSEAVVDGNFIGLPVDEDFEPELTDERVKNWVEQIRPEFEF
ncbi:flavodoxin I [Mariniphaga anaerophila]|uniref:Flavodoxin n=1 Tax=Mariniphaga anaerophila TaxID=1484053 RepID=A0A1M5A284_9BACT|nr:flavodoxin [Mariniphaga anaerophila]SHF24207.1 flavodoxin I [Mariniphaga anaerophila]